MKMEATHWADSTPKLLGVVTTGLRYDEAEKL